MCGTVGLTTLTVAICGVCCVFDGFINLLPASSSRVRPGQVLRRRQFERKNQAQPTEYEIKENSIKTLASRNHRDPATHTYLRRQAALNSRQSKNVLTATNETHKETTGNESAPREQQTHIGMSPIGTRTADWHCKSESKVACHTVLRHERNRSWLGIGSIQTCPGLYRQYVSFRWRYTSVVSCPVTRVPRDRGWARTERSHGE